MVHDAAILYRELTADDSFLKSFFKAVKEGRKFGAIANVFITGVLPITNVFSALFLPLQKIPRYLTDLNLRTDLSWVKRITGAHPGHTEEFVERLTTENVIAYDQDFLVSKFNMSQFFEKDFYPISFYYLGMLTKQDDFFLKLPNMNLRKIFVEYFNELHHSDVSTQYAEMMQRFSRHPDVPQLFADYWRLYVSQLPEAIFQQVNENFYREFKQFETALADFQLQPEDTRQIAGYVAGLLQEYPHARISQYVIYCMGNQGFRVFEVTA